MSKQMFQIFAGTAAVSLAFLLGMWSRPSSRPSRGEAVASSERIGSIPTRIGVSRVAPRRAVRANEEAAHPADAPVDVVEQVAFGHQLKDLYPAEARDETWAPHVEDFYVKEIAKFLSLVLPEAEDLEIECKTSMCKLSFVVPAERAESAYYREQAMPLGDVWQPFDELLDDGRVRVGMYVGIGAERRPLDALTVQYREQYQGRFAVPEDQLVMYFERDEARMREEKATLREETAR